MRKVVVVKGSGGNEYVLTPSVGASVVDRACAFATRDAQHHLRLALSFGREGLRLKRPEILSMLNHRELKVPSDEALLRQLHDQVANGRLLLILDRADAPPCGSDTSAQHAGAHKAAPKDEGKWGGNAAHWPQDKKLESMHPDLRPRVQGVLKDLAAKGFQPSIFYGWRSVAVQAKKKKEGKSGVTFSFHNVTDKNGKPCAYAADIVDKRWNWEPPAKEHGYWVALGEAAKANNLYWGGTWHKPDWAHVQLVPNAQLKHLRRACGY
jgi:peptidoglycan L-alanyl-D-glutamate endopeptidase CwlK